VFRRFALGLAALGALLLAFPATVLGHTIQERYQAPLPLIVYIAGAGLAVALSFAFVMLRNPPPPEDHGDGPARKVPGWLRGFFGALGLIGWLWIAAQTFFGGSGSGDVASLFLWVYGWVGLAMVSAFIGPVWSWIDPFTTIHRLLSWLADRLNLNGGGPAEYPERWGRWPAVVGFVIVVWVELVARVDGGRTLGLLMISYTLVTLAGMSFSGRDAWRKNAEVFSVWFGLLGRLAPFAPAGEPEDGLVRRRSFGAGLLTGGWTRDQVVIVALGTGAIIYDGLSQTQIYYDLFGGLNLFNSPVVRDTLIAGVFLGGIVALVLLVARRLNLAALGAGLLPVAVGYLVAHYLTYLLVDGQRIISAINDPLVRGDNLLPLNLAFFEPTPFLPAAVVWSIQLAAVVGGHVVGAWAGHAALVEEGSERKLEPARQLPLAALMVGLTSLTLWSLGQAALSPPPETQPAAAPSTIAAASAEALSR
jgi:hypothetical protein